MNVEPEDFEFLLQKYHEFLVEMFGENVEFRKYDTLKHKYNAKGEQGGS